MLFVENLNRNPHRNHGLEEWLMDNYEEDCFMLWRNETAILLGRHQNAYNELDIEYAREKGIEIVRRISGGGAVFTDPGNIMFTYISCNGQDDFADFQKFTAPVIKGLRSLGLPVVFTGRNDMEIHGQKFSGNAQCRYKNKVLHHGTLMYNADVTELAKALRVRPIKLKAKGVTSVKSRVTNLADHMEHPMDIEEFRSYLMNFVKQEMPDAKELVLTEKQWEEVAQRSKEKYETKEWIYGNAPRFDIQKETKLAGGLIDMFLDIRKGKISKAKIYGDFFSDGEVQDVEKALIGVLYEKDAIREVLRTLPVEYYFKNIQGEELLTAII